MIAKCCYNKELCSLLKCPVHFSDKIMTPNITNIEKSKSNLAVNLKYDKCCGASLYRGENDYSCNYRTRETRKLSSSHSSEECVEIGNREESKLKNEWDAASEMKTESVVSSVRTSKSRSVEPYTNKTQMTGQHLLDEGSEKSISQEFHSIDFSLYDSNIKYFQVYTCSLCENVFKNNYTLAKHMKTHNYCKYCRTKFKSITSLKRHSKNCIFEKCVTLQPKVYLKRLPSLHQSIIESNNHPNTSIMKEVKIEVPYISEEPLKISKTEMGTKNETCFLSELVVKKEISYISVEPLELSKIEMDIKNGPFFSSELIMKGEDVCSSFEPEHDDTNMFQYNCEFNNVKTESIDVEDHEICFNIACVKEEYISDLANSTDNTKYPSNQLNPPNLFDDEKPHKEEQKFDHTKAFKYSMVQDYVDEEKQLVLSDNEDNEENQERQRYSRFESEMKNMKSKYNDSVIGSLDNIFHQEVIPISDSVIMKTESKTELSAPCYSSKDSETAEYKSNNFTNKMIYESCSDSCRTKYNYSQLKGQKRIIEELFSSEATREPPQELCSRCPNERYIRFTTEPNLKLFNF